jgi:polyhydroxybutyrate depolymerase
MYMVYNWRPVALALVMAGCGDPRGVASGTDGPAGGGAAFGSGGAPIGQSGAGEGGASFGGAGGANGGQANAGGSAPGGAGSGGGGAPSAGACSMPPLAPGDYAHTIPHGGLERAFDLHVPPGYGGAQPAPVVFYLHPLLMDKSYLKGAGAIAKSDAEGFVAVFPDGVGRSWNGGACCGPANGAGKKPLIDDVGFIRAVVAHVKSVACVDDKRIYATGFSNGGFLSNRLACEAADLFAAVAPVSAVLGLDAAHCNPSRPVPVLALNGTADNLVPYDGGFSMPGVTSGTFMSAPESFAIWSAKNGCSGAPLVTFANGSAVCQTYAHCAGGAEVTLCTLEGAGHCWFGEPFCVLGKNSSDLPAADATWEFLKRFSLP